ncbi:MAG: hypothetical protein A3J65_03375 [Candidatus Buchananbacteria bacterium RIFCSPHIGHO2_02_FULL_45_11b]|uniref:Uncharacterized protein n=4 Tax=Candidatus Buchananiibacteriota TaxID=1817903 RepID=A0A1G1YKH3_9BACT|nr:MAG: hypothetical protein A2663_00820 [Candidatus Buchananbacteria bacterium RIFCSPHIGHO2_01_FULL_46_12]OGY52000.1 MAG: hypothetical protein A3J65_03375 [Candidatus Buchananbacteria bacterium RIFCSPHIGHO2_02_FULL_45_11b]OGY52845.1 MAG: hypothetical protein A3B15_00965 [Candidatus Buchananbacteria bacterium RIFCSPLOWO2_01_FULL_45_31]OGY57537.1 MAG: hypothetical protein A3H67_00540 [Candidatus Buchananbacteria bacterium RIFCSPLOWO2_02_FULL_46_11b]
MADLGDVLWWLKEEMAYWEAHDCADEWKQKVMAAAKKIGAAMRKEEHDIMSVGGAEEILPSLPSCRVLGPKAEAAYQEFFELLGTKNKAVEL